MQQNFVNSDDPTQSTRPGWLAYVTSLPTDDPAARMRVLRTLDALGCAILRDGVYMLPDSRENRLGLSRLTEHISRHNGTAYLLPVSALDDMQARAFRDLFDRSTKYEELIKNVESIESGFGISDPTSIARVLAKQRKDFEAIGALDFYSSPARERAAQALDRAERNARKLLFPPPPKPEPVLQSARHYFRRAWATRKPLWADRLASAWLVRRFIDSEAQLIWLEKSQECPVTAVGFGFEGATFANTSSGVTFEQLLLHFGLQGNPALVKIANLVSCLDIGGARVPEAAGVETLLLGAQRRSADPDELFVESAKTFDLLYHAYQDGPEGN